MIELTQNYLKELFDYRDGNLYWKVKKAQRTKIGDRAGWFGGDGYRYVSIDDRGYKEHRLIFLWYYGHLPEFIDHIDGNPSNNDISNLREATHQENCMNQGKTKSYGGKSTSSKFKGVSWHKAIGKWAASITINGKQKHLGLFTSEIEAALAYDVAAIERDGKYAKTNAMLYPEIFKARECCNEMKV